MTRQSLCDPKFRSLRSSPDRHASTNECTDDIRGRGFAVSVTFCQGSDAARSPSARGRSILLICRHPGTETQSLRRSKVDRENPCVHFDRGFIALRPAQEVLQEITSGLGRPKVLVEHLDHIGFISPEETVGMDINSGPQRGRSISKSRRKK
jgi:hypothetical protein